ncbi:MAG: hypothetical protein A3H35_11305 [Betaproteobacteria bacterium RIFCSPLOWO2_02_FULL_62_17]|nr:MAG: hypothetical protein A3H35_11305 [Betaproteobacteria bacterium RIFCSPLOWO2_02_FULL_62_17]
MLENDLIWQEFMRCHGAEPQGRTLDPSKRLLEYNDGELWDLIGGRSESPDAKLAEVTKMLRDCTVPSE